MKVYRGTKLETPCNPAANRVAGRPNKETRKGGFVNKQLDFGLYHVTETEEKKQKVKADKHSQKGINR